MFPLRLSHSLSAIPSTICVLFYNIIIFVSTMHRLVTVPPLLQRFIAHRSILLAFSLPSALPPPHLPVLHLIHLVAQRGDILLAAAGQQDRLPLRLQLQESSMYPTLYRLVEKKLVSDRQEKVGKRRMRVYYHLEEAGKVYLNALRKEYCSICRGMLYILGIENINELEE